MGNVKGNGLPAAAEVSLTDLIIVVNPGTGVAYKATVSQFITHRLGVENNTADPLDETALNAAYPTANYPFEVLCANITDGPMIYKKSSTAWYGYPLGTV